MEQPQAIAPGIPGSKESNPTKRFHMEMVLVLEAPFLMCPNTMHKCLLFLRDRVGFIFFILLFCKVLCKRRFSL